MLIVFGVWLAFSEGHPVHASPYEVSAVFENVPTIAKGRAVRIAGVNVGKVTKVEPWAATRRR